MKRSLKFLTLSFLILLAQSSLAASHVEGPGSVGHSQEVVAVGISYTDNNGIEYKNEAGNPKPEEATKKYYATAVGIANTASGVGSSAFGGRNIASREGSSAIGFYNTASGVRSSAFGNLTYVSGEGSGAFGIGKYDYRAGDYAYKIEGNNSWAIGSYNRIAAGSDNNHILGNNVSIGAGITNSVALGNNSAVSSSNEVSVGSATLKRKITNVADGEVSETSTDAVNGRQLYAIQSSGTVGIENLRKEVRDAKDEMRGIGSLSAALSALHPMQYDPQAPNHLMAE